MAGSPMPSRALPALLLTIALGLGLPAAAAPRNQPEPGPVDWVRAGLLVGVDFEAARTASLGGGVLGLCGLRWDDVYLLPVNVRATASGNGGIAFGADLEFGWFGEWKHDQVRIGLGAGYGFWGLGTPDRFVQGVSLRPALRYRRYWEEVGVEVFVEFPLVLGPGNGGSGYAGSRVVVRGWSPILGVTVGM